MQPSNDFAVIDGTRCMDRLINSLTKRKCNCDIFVREFPIGVLVGRDKIGVVHLFATQSTLERCVCVPCRKHHDSLAGITHTLQKLRLGTLGE